AVERLRSASRLDAPHVLARMLDHLDSSGRFALLKLATGGLRVGVSARLAKQALANAFGLELDAVEEVWHGLRPPFTELFDLAERFRTPAVLDGEPLVRGEAQGSGLEVASAASFNALQQRLGRKNVSQKMLGQYPAFVRLYDILLEGSEDLRELPWEERRKR